MHSDLSPLRQVHERRDLDDSIPGWAHECRKANNSQPGLHTPTEGMNPGGESSNEEDTQELDHEEDTIWTPIHYLFEIGRGSE